MKIWNFIFGWQRTSHSRCDIGRTRPGLRPQFYARLALFLTCISGLFSSAYAAEDEPGEVTPDLEFLEFLGQFETDAGEWVDPNSLLTEEFTELLDASAATESANDSADTNNATDTN